MRLSTVLAYTLLPLVMAACSGIEIEPAPVEQFAAGDYRYYSWRSNPLPQDTRSSDPVYAIDPVLRREVDANLSQKGYILDPERAQFTVDYIFAKRLLDGERSNWASNVSPHAAVNPNRQIDQASVDNAIALGGVKETSNIILQFNDKQSHKEIWHVTLTKFVEDANRADISRVGSALRGSMKRALKTLPEASAP